MKTIPLTPSWSLDAMLHSGNRGRLLAEVARVLLAGGDFIFTDLMQADDCPEGVLQPILERLLLEDMASFARHPGVPQGGLFV